MFKEGLLKVRSFVEYGKREMSDDDYKEMINVLDNSILYIHENENKLQVYRDEMIHFIRENDKLKTENEKNKRRMERMEKRMKRIIEEKKYQQEVEDSEEEREE